ncbi:MAG: DUF692 domain-containing protein [Rhodobacteraceae bacterium]|nr:DUF692 domain-containing protein [Paracoccaceae bacterium]
MDGSSLSVFSIPALPGVGYKPQHHEDLKGFAHDVAWLEIHAENYMGDGGPALAGLRSLRERFPVSCHGVGLSIGAGSGLDSEHLERLRILVDWLKPGMFSEHLAWSTHDTAYLNDLFPLPYNSRTLRRVVEHIDQVQTALDRPMLLENPSSYLRFAETTMSECDFLAEVSARTGCGLLLDVNNVFVSATNQQYSAIEYLDDFPIHLVGEIHLGGHEADEDEIGNELLIDSHSRPIVDPVWELYAEVIDRCGPKPTLIEWDNDIPNWPVLAAEATRAARVLSIAGSRVPDLAAKQAQPTGPA